LIQLKSLVVGINDGAAGFMVESLQEFLKALMNVKVVDESTMAPLVCQFTDHLILYVAQSTSHSKTIHPLAKTSVINVIGSDLCGHILSFVDDYALANLSSV
jgi:hypothetical protein